MSAATVKFRKLYRPPPLDINLLKNEIQPGSGNDWHESGEEGREFSHANGGHIDVDIMGRVVAALDKTIRGQRVTLELHGATLGTAKLWVEMQ